MPKHPPSATCWSNLEQMRGSYLSLPTSLLFLYRVMHTFPMNSDKGHVMYESIAVLYADPDLGRSQSKKITIIETNSHWLYRKLENWLLLRDAAPLSFRIPATK